MHEIIKTAMKRQQNTLSEYESKKLLMSAGIPVTREKLARSKAEAIEMADEIGYPVVMKGCGAQLTHKTERGIIKIDIKDTAATGCAYDDILSTKIEMDGVLIGEMITGDREFVAGLNRDSQFGPCVMFGLGGIYTEALNDVSFRVAPLSPFDVIDMINEIRAKKLLGEYRGKAGVDNSVLCDILTGIGRLGLENKEIKEIDINPLKLSNGRLFAVDALVILSE